MKKDMVKTGLKIALVAGGVFALVPTVYGQGIGIQTLERLTAGTPQQLERGEQVYEDQCATCHGDEGRGGAALGQRMGADGFVGVDVERSGLKSIYSVIAHGYQYGDDGEHPVFDNLFHQDRWAVTHYVHNLIDDPAPDPEAVVSRIRREAREGVCDPAIRDEVAGYAEPESEEQIQLGVEVYELRCATCHGDEGRGDGPGAGTVPPARDFHDPADEWTNGTSPLAIFNTLDQGIEGTAMAAFGHLPEEELWAMVHYLREELIPDGELEELTEAQIDEVCRSLSAPPRPEPIAIDKAMKFLADGADEERFIRFRNYGDPIVHTDADPIRGQEIYDQSCASCHGAEGVSSEPIGPYGKFPPYLHIEPSPLVPASVGGTYEDVAERTLVGPHASLPERPSVAAFSEQDWKDVQAYITQFEGEGRDRIRVSDEVEPPSEHTTFGRIRITAPLNDEQAAAIEALVEDGDDPLEMVSELADMDFLSARDIEVLDEDGGLIEPDEAPDEDSIEDDALSDDEVADPGDADGDVVDDETPDDDASPSTDEDAETPEEESDQEPGE